jgi:hypothetical protein
VWRAFVDAGRIHDFLELARGHFARAIGQRLASHARSRGLSAGERAALAQGLAGALLGLLAWWVRGSRRESPEHIDALFHRLVWSGAGGPPRR